MTTTNRILLLDPWGDDLLSGDRLLSEPVPAFPPPLERDEQNEPVEAAPVGETTSVEEEEPIPETLRSSVLVRAREPVSRPIVVEVDESDHHAA
ncbi:MAG: hypothetical protein BGO98_07415 [Myxococcales bacterium 68-20]|nr:MAG: hypothetical protein BGO98_07415 [Myxococcales bacterium 68-20]